MLQFRDVVAELAAVSQAKQLQSRIDLLRLGLAFTIGTLTSRQPCEEIMAIGKQIEMPRSIKAACSMGQTTTWRMRVMFVDLGGRIEYRLLIGKESFEAAVCTLIGLQHGSSGLSTEQLSAREDAIKLFTRAFRNRNAVQLDDGRVVWTEAAAVL